MQLGQALSIRPDILSPAAMNELQKLCDKVPSFDNAKAMQVIADELGAPWHEVCILLSAHSLPTLRESSHWPSHLHGHKWHILCASGGAYPCRGATVG